MGHVNPLRLGLLLTHLGEAIDADRELTAVTVRRDRPGDTSHRNLQSAFARQVAAWKQMPLVTVKTRPLRYQPIAWSSGAPSEWRGEEKGIDVLIALDIVLGARDDRYDVAVPLDAAMWMTTEGAAATAGPAVWDVDLGRTRRGKGRTRQQRSRMSVCRWGINENRQLGLSTSWRESRKGCGRQRGLHLE